MLLAEKRKNGPIFPSQPETLKLEKISSINLPCGTVLTTGPITQTVLQHLAHYGCSINITEHCSPIWTRGKALRALNLWHHGTCLYGCKAQKAGWKQVSAKGREGGAGQTSMRMVTEEGPWKPLPLIGSSAFCVQNQLKKHQSIVLQQSSLTHHTCVPSYWEVNRMVFSI